MRIFFTVQDDSGLESLIDQRFGRAPFFLIYDSEKQEVVSVEKNPYRNMEHGVGIQVANHVIQNGCHTAVGPKFGPKAESVLRAGGVAMKTSGDMSVRRALDNMEW